MRTSRRTLLKSAAASLLPAPAIAQSGWPSQPIKMIVTQAAGGTPDIVCRLVCERLSRALGQQVFVENRPGAGNVVGAQAAARAAPDGNTLLWATAASLITNVFTVKALPYDPRRDFVTIARAARGPFLLVANPGLPANNLPELIALAKAKPRGLNVATDGPRNFSGLVAAWLIRSAGVDINPVPYSAMPQGVQDVIGGRVELAILAIPSAGPQMAAGMLKPIAITSAQRAPGYEQAAPIADTIPGFDFYGWLGVSAPAGVPRPILERLNQEISKILDTAEFAGPLAKMGFYSMGGASLEKANADVEAEFAVWRKVVTDIGLEPE